MAFERCFFAVGIGPLDKTATDFPAVQRVHKVHRKETDIEPSLITLADAFKGEHVKRNNKVVRVFQSNAADPLQVGFHGLNLFGRRHPVHFAHLAVAGARARHRGAHGVVNVSLRNAFLGKPTGRVTRSDEREVVRSLSRKCVAAERIGVCLIVGGNVSDQTVNGGADFRRNFAEPMLFCENSLPIAEGVEGIVFFKTGDVLQAIRKIQNSIDVIKPEGARQVGTQAFFEDMRME